MIPRRLILDHFMGHLYSDIDCTTFNSVLIVGKMRDNERISNGIGKSTLFKAISYVLFNASPAKLQKVINDDAHKCSVSLEFELEKEIYRVIRKRNRNEVSELKLEQYVGQDWVDRSAKTNKETEAELAKLIKISYKAFQNSVLFAQRDLGNLAGASPADRKALLKEPLQISIYNKYEKAASKRLSAQQKLLDECLAVITSLGDPQADITTFNTELSTINLKLEEVKLTREGINKELETRRGRAKDLEALLDSSEADRHHKLQEANNKKKHLDNEIARTQTKLDNTRSQEATYTQECQEERSKVEALEQRLVELKELVFRPEAEIVKDKERLVENEHKARVLISKLEAEIAGCKVNLPAGAECPTCLQTISEEHRESCEAKATERRQELSKKLEQSQQKFEKLLTNKQKYETELKEWREHQMKLKQTEVAHQAAIHSLQKNEEFLGKVGLMVKELVSSQEALNKELAEVIATQTDLLEMIQKMSVNAEDVNQKVAEINQEIRGLESDLKINFNEVSDLNLKIGSLQGRIKSREEDAEKLKGFLEKQKELEQQVSLHQKVMTAFSSNGVPSLIINTVLDDLQLEVNQILAELRPELRLQFVVSKDDKDTLDIDFMINERPREFDELSGGQQIYFTLALRLGLSAILQRRVGVKLGFLLLDEIEDGFDDSGLDSYISIIKQWESKYKIFAITHNAKLQKHFHHFVVVEGSEKGSNASTTFSI